MKRRVVVTGLGAVTPIGNTVKEFWTSVFPLKSSAPCPVATILLFVTIVRIISGFKRSRIPHFMPDPLLF